jgi:hypothetical protein
MNNNNNFLDICTNIQRVSSFPYFITENIPINDFWIVYKISVEIYIYESHYIKLSPDLRSLYNLKPGWHDGWFFFGVHVTVHR